MKIFLLEHPRQISADRCNDIANTPLSSCLLSGYVAAMLETKGHQVEIVEGFMDKLSYDEIESRVTDMQPDILGVHMVYHWQDDTALTEFLKKIKSGRMASYVTAYGFYPTIAFEEILRKYDSVDSVILGEPEVTFAELVEVLESNKRPGEISGLAQDDGLGSITGSWRKPVDELDCLPFPVRTEGMFRIPEVNLQGSRGCYGGCTFCYINPFYGTGSLWRGRSPENIVAEIDEIIAKWGKTDFYFTDPNFFGPGQKGQVRALKLAELLKPRNIRFGIEGRVNDIHDETIDALVQAGLRHILIGLESGHNNSLKRMNKMTTVAQNENAIKILRKYGIEPNIGFIMFEPDASLEDVRVNFEFLKRNDLLRNLPITANVLYHHQIILKGTRAYKDLHEAGRLQVNDTSPYEGETSFSNPKVAILANVMRQITNYLFQRMAGIWSGKIAEPEDASLKYSRINDVLVSVFDDTLRTLESEGKFSEDRTIALVTRVQKEITSGLQ